MGSNAAATLVPASELQIAATRETSDLVLSFVSSIQEARARYIALRQFVDDVLIPGLDYGVPGEDDVPAEKKAEASYRKRYTLYQPGAEKLCEIFGLTAVPTVTQRTEDWDRGFFHYEVRCDLISRRSGHTVGAGLGSCNSYETKYRYRRAERLCPECEAPAIIKSKFGRPGWYCFPKKGGCGARFALEDQAIVGQELGRVENPDLADTANTILKMANKRAFIGVTKAVTRLSHVFTEALPWVPAAEGGEPDETPGATLEKEEEPKEPQAPSHLNAEDTQQSARPPRVEGYVVGIEQLETDSGVPYWDIFVELCGSDGESTLFRTTKPEHRAVAVEGRRVSIEFDTPGQQGVKRMLEISLVVEPDPDTPVGDRPTTSPGAPPPDTAPPPVSEATAPDPAGSGGEAPSTSSTRPSSTASTTCDPEFTRIVKIVARKSAKGEVDVDVLVGGTATNTVAALRCTDAPLIGAARELMERADLGFEYTTPARGAKRLQRIRMPFSSRVTSITDEPPMNGQRTYLLVLETGETLKCADNWQAELARIAYRQQAEVRGFYFAAENLIGHVEAPRPEHPTEHVQVEHPVHEIEAILERITSDGPNHWNITLEGDTELLCTSPQLYAAATGLEGRLVRVEYKLIGVTMIALSIEAVETSGHD